MSNRTSNVAALAAQFYDTTLEYVARNFDLSVKLIELTVVDKDPGFVGVEISSWRKFRNLRFSNSKARVQANSNFRYELPRA